MVICALASTLAIRAALQGRSGHGDRGLRWTASASASKACSKRYGEGDTAVDALKEVNMTRRARRGGRPDRPSGSGKSTLLKCLGAVIEPTAGRMTLGDEVIYDDGWKISDLKALRRDRIGFVFQAPYLIPFLDVTDNVALLPMLAGRPNARRASARWNCSRRSMSAPRPGRLPSSSPAASSSASPSPARWPTSRR
jgi:ABC-type lipoprotein export system ATPase subunit